MGAGRQRAEEEMAEWERKERQTDTRDGLRGTPRGQKPAASTEIHRYPEWERDRQRHPET